MDIDSLKARALKGKKDAQYHLGILFLHGNKVDQDALEAEKWFKLASKKNHPDALFELGVITLNHGDIKLALDYFKRALKYKNEKAHKQLGDIYSGQYDFNLEDNDLALKHYYAYYDYDTYDGLEPLLKVYDRRAFPNAATEKKFLEEALEFGLVKAKFYLGRFYLTEKKYYDGQKAVDYLESYYAATADANAAKELYFLYAPNEDKYPNFKEKDGDRAREFLQRTITSNTMLEGTEFVQTYGIYLPKSMMKVNDYLSYVIRKMKTSMAIDGIFSDTVSLDTFDVRLHFSVETVYDYKGTFSFKQKHVEKEIIEKEVKKKETVRKGLKKTGSVKIPKTVQKTKKRKSWVDQTVEINDEVIHKKTLGYEQHSSLNSVLERLDNKHYLFTFEQPIAENQLKKQIEKLIYKQFKKPRKTKKLSLDFDYDFVHIGKPELHIKYTYKKDFYQDIIDLSHEDDIAMVRFPFNTKFKRTLRGFLRRQAVFNQLNHLVIPLWLVSLPYALYLIYHNQLSDISAVNFMYTWYLYHVVGIMVTMGVLYLFIKKLPFRRVSVDTFVEHYDQATIKTIRNNTLVNLLKIVFKYLLILGLVGYILHSHSIV